MRIDEQLLKEARQLAVHSGKSVTSIIEDALRVYLSRQRRYEQREPIRLITFDGEGLLPGVDLDDSSAQLDVMESSNDPH
ncbi:MAG: DUF2191 domain-containing protein [Dehalococcoidia bacterium]|nr:DUF2191 domain-containing protein [Dehalococcoidia bacterium]